MSIRTDSTGDPIDVLLVEDNPGDIRLTREAFDEGNIASTLHVTTDGVEALDYLYQRDEHAGASRPDIVLLDLNLPRKNGQDVLAEVKADPDLKRIPVVILTSSEAESDVVESYERHTNAFLTKPVDPDAFIDLVRRFEDFWFGVVTLPSE